MLVIPGVLDVKLSDDLDHIQLLFFVDVHLLPKKMDVHKQGIITWTYVHKPSFVVSIKHRKVV